MPKLAPYQYLLAALAVAGLATVAINLKGQFLPTQSNQVSVSGTDTIPSPAQTKPDLKGTLVINGSTSLVNLNVQLQKRYAGSNLSIRFTTSSSTKGLAELVQGRVQIAALSRPLTAAEQSANPNLVAVPVQNDSVAVVVGYTAPYPDNVTTKDLVSIFTGQQTTLANYPVRFVNRPAVSGTRQVFQELVLRGAAFGTNGQTLAVDATTPMLQALGTDGIGYATYAQVKDQSTVRVLKVDGSAPGTANYPVQRQLYYVYSKDNQLACDFVTYAAQVGLAD